MGFGKDYVSGCLEGIRTLKNCKRVPSFKGRIQREIGIQLELIAGTAVYVYEFPGDRRRSLERKPEILRRTLCGRLSADRLNGCFYAK